MLCISAGLSESVSKTMVIAGAGFTLEITASMFPAYVCTGPSSGVIFDAVRNRVVEPEASRQVHTNMRQASPALTPAVRRGMGHLSGNGCRTCLMITRQFFQGGVSGNLRMVGGRSRSLRILPKYRRMKSASDYRLIEAHLQHSYESTLSRVEEPH